MAALKIYDGSSWVTLPSGIGVPAGGTTGQHLVKASGTNYDTTWATPSSDGAWTSFTPSFTAGITAAGNATTFGFYRLLGTKTVQAQFRFTCGTTTTYDTTAGVLVKMAAPFGSPVLRSDFSILGAGVMNASGTGGGTTAINSFGLIRLDTVSGLTFLGLNSPTNADFRNIEGRHLASTSKMDFSFVYEIS